MDPKPGKVEMETASEADLAYIAGLMDGEGCIGIVMSKGKRLGIQVAITMCHSDGIRFIQDRYGGSIIFKQRAKNGENWKPVYSWRLNDRKAERLLRDIQSRLLVKRAQCDLALSVRDHLRNGGILVRGNNPPDPDRDRAIIAFRESAKARMHELNKRGIY